MNASPAEQTRDAGALPERAPVALVTGGAVRVGRALSIGLAEAGFDVAVNFHSSEGAAHEVADDVEKVGRTALLVPGDVGDAGAVEEIADRVLSHFGRIDLLVNNASTFFQTPFVDVSGEEWDRAMAVNVKGPFLLIRALADALAGSGGLVVNIADLSAFTPWDDFPHHSVSKAALVQLTRVAAKALAPHVRVNAIAPGTVLPPEDYDEAARERSRSRTLVGELGSPEDVVRTVLFLVRSPFVTGEVVVVDGGQSLSGARD